jgi:hypothetical protein
MALPLTEIAGETHHPSTPAMRGVLPGLDAAPEATRAVEAGVLASLPDRSRLAPGAES